MDILANSFRDIYADSFGNFFDCLYALQDGDICALWNVDSARNFDGNVFAGRGGDVFAFFRRATV